MSGRLRRLAVLGMLAVLTAASSGGASGPTVAGVVVGAQSELPATGDQVGLVDPGTGLWRLRSGGNVSAFYYGDPGDVPFVGDWDCDGVDTPGAYRQSDGFGYLRNANSQGVADITFFLGNPGDVPLAGDFDGDGCDTVAVYRRSQQRFYISDRLGGAGRGFIADFAFLFGNPGDRPVVGDWDGDGVDEVGLHRPTTGFFYWRETLDTGVADGQMFFGDPGDRFVAGDWGTVDGADSPGVFRPSDTTFYFRHDLTQGVADSALAWGEPDGLPVAGRFGGPTEAPEIGGTPTCAFFPTDNPWNTDVSALPVHPNSDAYVASIGSGNLHPDFGTFYDGGPIGIPYVLVGAGQPGVSVDFTYADESDPGPYPIPPDAPIEGGPDADGDRHVLVLDDDECVLYEMFDAHRRPDGSWFAGSGAVFDLSSNELRPDFWTSADAAGLPILPGLVRYDEAVEDGVIDHALRFTVERTQRAFIHPATHFASDSTDPDLPPMGLRLRMKAGYDCSPLSVEVQVICAALKRYGMFVADNGGDWFVTGTHDSRWDDDALGDVKSIPGSAFEAVDTGEPIITG